MVLVPAGSFDMGSDQHPDAKPVHTITLAPFYLAKYEMTQAQWKALMSANPSYYQGEKFPQADKMPVEQVSWEDCRAMLAEINKERPAEDSACRPRPNGNMPRAPVRPNRCQPLKCCASPGCGRIQSRPNPSAPDALQPLSHRLGSDAAPHPVGTREPNRWGLYDMLGNVSEWCSSLYQPYPYAAGDGREAATGQGTRVVRGANFADSADAADAALRHSDGRTGGSAGTACVWRSALPPNRRSSGIYSRSKGKPQRQLAYTTRSLRCVNKIMFV